LLMGTPAYMPPEQVQGSPEANGPAGDVYSLGVLLFELLTGRVPFQGPAAAVLAQAVHDAPPRPGALRPGLDPPLDAVVPGAREKQPAARFARMADLTDALAGFLASATTTPALPAVPQAAPALTPTVPSRPAAPSPQLAGKVLELLRRYGWARATQKMRQRA